MNLQIENRDAFIGTTTRHDLVNYAGDGTASLTVRTQHTIAGPRTDYVVYRNGKAWHESKDLGGAIAGWNSLVISEKLEA